MVDQAIKESKKVPGVGAYFKDMKMLNASYDATTRGASRGWK
jgi:hypothetical protein